jgi:hypothetical protein
MTTLSQYLKAERIDRSEPASFYVPGLGDWRQFKTPKGKAGLAARSRAQEEIVYPVETGDAVEQ